MFMGLNFLPIIVPKKATLSNVENVLASAKEKTTGQNYLNA